MKVAMVTPWAVRCGIFSYSRDLSEALAQAGVDVYIVRLPRFGVMIPDIMKLVAGSVPKEVDLIHVQHEYGLYKGLEGVFYGAEGLKGKRKPVLTTMHAVGNWDLDGVICGSSDRVVTHNEFCARVLRHPNVIIPHGVRPAQPLPMVDSKESYGLRAQWAIVGYLGFISSYKNLEILIEAIKGVPEAALLIGGGWHVETETSYIQQLKAWSLKVLPGRVQWLGYVPDEELPRAYGAMDIVVYPSRQATESGALLTALGYGKAVIASRLKPFQEKEKRGALVTFRGVTSLRRKIKKLISDGAARRELEDSAKKYAQDNAWPRIAELHRSLYEDITTV